MRDRLKRRARRLPCSSRARSRWSPRRTGSARSLGCPTFLREPEREGAKATETSSIIDLAQFWPSVSLLVASRIALLPRYARGITARNNSSSRKYNLPFFFRPLASSRSPCGVRRWTSSASPTCAQPRSSSPRSLRFPPQLPIDSQRSPPGSPTQTSPPGARPVVRNSSSGSTLRLGSICKAEGKCILFVEAVEGAVAEEIRMMGRRRRLGGCGGRIIGNYRQSSSRKSRQRRFHSTPTLLLHQYPSVAPHQHPHPPEALLPPLPLPRRRAKLQERRRNDPSSRTDSHSSSRRSVARPLRRNRVVSRGSWRVFKSDRIEVGR